MSRGEEKLSWEGEILSVQPRIRLLRSFDERSHSYLGYVLRIRGSLAGENREFAVAVGKGAHEKHRFRAGGTVSGMGVLVADPRRETADLYRVSRVRMLSRGVGSDGTPPPYAGIPPALEKYRERGHRRLATITYRSKCSTCLWGCEMAVEIIVDHWNPTNKRYRKETFCYGPKNCPFYRAGPTRKVPGRRGMTWEEEDWIDGEETAHRGLDE